MTGKTIHELTTAELRSECTVHGSSISGSKPDLMIRLEDNIREIGQDPVNVRFSCVQPLIVRSTCSTDEQPYATSTRIETVASQFNRRPSAEQARTGHGEQHFQTAVEQLHMLKQTLPQTKDETSFEARLLALETSLSRFLLESRSTTAQQPPNNTVPRYDEHPSPVQVTTRTHEDYQSGGSNVNGRGNAQNSA
ncbi:SAP domain-containing protein, partial [Aphis craccivora]